MVKPPKTMQPEALGKNLQKAGRTFTKSFGEDSFHNYMARKIHMQREQFGVVLPPPPPAPERPDKKPVLPRTPKSPPALKKHQRFSPKFSRSENVPKCTSSRRVSFAPESVSESNKGSTPKNNYRKKRGSRGSAVRSILKKLKRRHGRRSSLSKNEEDEKQLFIKEQQQEVPSSEEKVPKILPINPIAKAAGVPLNKSTNEKSKQKLQLKLPSPQPGHVSKKRPRDRPDLFFQGVVAMVNGYTTPDSDTIQRLLHRHGGDLEKYETVRVTHIIAEHLSDAKAKMYKRQKNPRPVVYPNWILDSIKAQRQLPSLQYTIKEMLPDDAKLQPQLASFFNKSTVASSRMLHISKVVGPSSQDDQRMMSSFSSQQVVNANGPNEGRTCKKLAQQTSQSSAMAADHTVPSPAEESDQSNPNSRKPEAAYSSPHRQSPRNRSKESPVTPGRTDDKYIGGAIRTVGTDPNFLESFFSNSRLSYIGSFALRSQRSSNILKRKSKPTGPHRRFVFHIDMDCFFAAVVLRNFPQYRNRPVAISHFGKANGDVSHVANSSFKGSTSECATCNYEARRYGIKKGMFLGRAKELCPDLVVLNYDFEGYKEVSKDVSEILDRIASENAGVVEEISCDESYAELFIEGNGLEEQFEAARKLAELVRAEIFAKTDCTATVGVAENKFIAKLATDRVKPNGLFVALDAKELLRRLDLREIHGIGYRLEKRLAESGLTSVADVWDRDDAVDTLKGLLGEQLGRKIWSFCQGKDDRPVEPAIRRTIGAECNYGVRFDGKYGPHFMIGGLVKEIEKRMELAGVRGAKLTLKMKRRKPNAPEPPKFLGHGSCFTLSKSRDVPQNAHTRDATILKKICIDLFQQLNVPKEDIRGMGVVVSNLIEDSASSSKDCGIKKFFKDNLPSAKSKSPNNAVDATERDQKLPATDDSTTEEIISPVRYDEDDSSFVEVVGTNDQIETDDIDIPALSQLHMSQVGFLPSPLRRDIMRKVQIEQSQKRLASDRRKKTESCKATTSTGYQPKMEEMLLLDAVRSGKRSIGEADGQEISLTQFERLPFEVKLEVASGNKPRPRTLKASLKKAPQQNDSIRTHDDEVALMTKIEPHEADDNDFFLSNVLPLTKFLDEHPPGEDSQRHVQAFFDELFDASMMYELLTLLKTIRNRSDLWSKGPFDMLAASMKSKFFSATGTVLDL